MQNQKINFWGIFIFLFLIATMLDAKALTNDVYTHERDPFHPAQSLSTQINLQDYPLNKLKLVGTLHQGKQYFAMIRDPKNHIYKLTLGDFIGLEKAKITQITDGAINIAWRVEQQIFTDRLVVFAE